jgi:hypothetical protein
MEWTPSESGLAYSSRGVSADAVEVIRIQTDPRGRFISGRRSLTRRATGQVSQERIWRESHKVYFQRGPEKNEISKEFELAQDQMLAVDGSLLLMFRFFPFGEQKEWKVLMVDFSGYSATVTVRQTARENITVPAGDFECYRMEAIVNIPVLRPKVTYWISASHPHFMVKHRGKRGPFTPYYATSLISIQ